MKTIDLAAFAALGFTQIPLRGLTAEEAQILSHFSFVQQPDGQGGMVPTIVLTGVNLQIVNGLGSTHSVNGTGNLIAGYNETGNFLVGDFRTGSHSLILGTKASFSASSCIVGGTNNSVESLGGVILSGEQSRIGQGALLGVIATGFRNDLNGPGGSFIGAGTHNTLASQHGAIVGGQDNTAGEGRAVVIGGGQGNAASGTASVVSGGTARTAAGNGSWAGGQFYSPN